MTAASGTGADISVVICVYTEERWAAIAAAIRSVQAQTRPAREIILVVDHNQRLLERLRQTYPALKVIPNIHARGLSGGKNTGIGEASGEFVAFLDDDATAVPEWLDQFHKGFQRAGVMAVGGRVDPDWAGGVRPTWFPEEFDWVVGCSYRGLPEQSGFVRNLFGGNMAVRRQVFGEVGGFRSDLGRLGGNGGGCEEVEFCIRAAHGRPDSMFYLPEARILHQVPAQRMRIGYFGRRCYGEGGSKARLSLMPRSSGMLATERRYVLRTLPAGVLRGLADPFRSGRLDGWARAAMIGFGLTLTTAGYLVTRCTWRPDKEAATAPGAIAAGLVTRIERT